MLSNGGAVASADKKACSGADPRLKVVTVLSVGDGPCLVGQVSPKFKSTALKNTCLSCDSSCPAPLDLLSRSVMAPYNDGPAAATRARAALSDISNSKGSARVNPSGKVGATPHVPAPSQHPALPVPSPRRADA